MNSATSSKSPSITNNDEELSGSKNELTEKDSGTTAKGHSSNDPSILIVDPKSFTTGENATAHSEGTLSSFNFVSIKKENFEDDSIEVISDDSSNIGDIGGVVKVEAVENPERHFVKVENPVLFGSDDDDWEEEEEGEVSGFSSEVRILDTGANPVKPSIFVKPESLLKRSQIQKDGNNVIISGGSENDTIYSESFSTAVLKAPKLEILEESDESQSVEEILENENACNESILGQSSFLTALKDNLKRKSEIVQVKNLKKKKTVVNVAKSSPVPSAAKAVPGLAKLRNIIGSNFKKLNLNLSETVDVKAELGLSYKHDDPLIESAVSKVNADGSGYTCPKCKAVFKWKTTLKFHMFNHLEDKAHECNVCFKLFLSSSYLNEHKKSQHSENYERVYRCSECSGQFDNETSLTCHMISHAKPESYVCHVCREKFTSLYSLNSHKAKHSSAIKYECKPCDLRFKTLKTLTKHIATHDVQKGQKNKK